MKIGILHLCYFGLMGLFSTTISAANDRVGGSGTTSNITINSSWTILRQVTHTVSGGGFNDCMAVASADTLSPPPSSSGLSAFFTITSNNISPNVNTSCTRTLSWPNNFEAEVPVKAISTNCGFIGLTSTNGLGGGNTHIFYFLGRSSAASSAVGLVVDDNRLDFVCVNRD